MIIQNAIYWVYGLPWSGKSMFGMMVASLYPRIYGNLEIRRFWRIVSNQCANIEEIERIPFWKEKGVCVIDEAGLNVNSRRSSDDANLAYGKLGMLSRKKNIDIFVIAQLDYSVDKYLRDLSSFTFNMSSFFESWEGLKFSTMIKDRFWQILWAKELDMLEYMRISWYSYQTLDESIIDRGDLKKGRINAGSSGKLWFSPMSFLTQ